MTKKDIDFLSNATFPTAAQSSLNLSSESSVRVPCYCEENVWRLAYRRIHGEQNPKRKTGTYHVVFVSNEIKCVPMFYQLANDDPHQAVFWDYHVILLWTKQDNQTVVLDIDSHLPFPSTLQDYLKNSFPYYDFAAGLQQKKHAPVFRVVEATIFLRDFCSDRMHMYNKEANKWMAPPPEYDCIHTGNGSNLQDYISISSEKKGENKTALNMSFGTIFTLQQLREHFRNQIPATATAATL